MLVERHFEATWSGGANDAMLPQKPNSDLLRSSRDHSALSSFSEGWPALFQLLVALFRVLLAQCFAELALDPKFGHLGKNAHRRHALGAVQRVGMLRNPAYK
jgi:hypothetical protein